VSGGAHSDLITMIKPGILVGIIIFLLLSWLLFYQNIYRLWGYYVTTDEDTLAQYLVDHRLPVSDCRKLMHLERGAAPSVSEKRLECVIRYAAIVKDPSICELLMPSEYGMNCVGGAIHEQPCWLAMDRSVRWTGGQASLRECEKKDNKRSAEGNLCCHVARVRSLKHVNDCSPVANRQDMFDQCQYAIAMKNHDPSACTTIVNDNIRSACDVQTNALIKDPTLCSDCLKPLE